MLCTKFSRESRRKCQVHTHCGNTLQERFSFLTSVALTWILTFPNTYRERVLTWPHGLVDGVNPLIYQIWPQPLSPLYCCWILYGDANDDDWDSLHDVRVYYWAHFSTLNLPLKYLSPIVMSSIVVKWVMKFVGNTTVLVPPPITPYIIALRCLQTDGTFDHYR